MHQSKVWWVRRTGASKETSRKITVFILISPRIPYSASDEGVSKKRIKKVTQAIRLLDTDEKFARHRSVGHGQVDIVKGSLRVFSNFFFLIHFLSSVTATLLALSLSSSINYDLSYGRSVRTPVPTG